MILEKNNILGGDRIFGRWAAIYHPTPNPPGAQGPSLGEQTPFPPSPPTQYAMKY